MKWEENNHYIFGKSLYADNGVVQLIIPLEYGIRIGHFSYINEENVFYEQSSKEQDLTTEDGWRIRGGHRLWLAPEDDDTYFPDNDPISYMVQGDDIILHQNIDKRLGVKKSIQISFGKDASVSLIHGIRNCNQTAITRSLWAISAMAPGGTEVIPLGHQEDKMSHWHRISWWDNTCLGDERVTYEKERIIIRHYPIDKQYKIGVGHPDGPICYANHGVVFEKTYDVNQDSVYPDGNVSFETFFCVHMAEMESLSPLVTIKPGESAYHKEIWTLRREVK